MRSKINRDSSLDDPSRTGLTRRRLLRNAGGCAALASMNWSSAQRSLYAQEFEPLNRFPRMVHEFFVQRARDSAARHKQRLEALSTAADAQAYVQSAQQRIGLSFGPKPERTPLNARTTKTVDRKSYRIENVIFESRPNFPVTANLYLPKNSSGPVPGVVGTCGHSTNGKAAEAYQAFAQGLARLGFACLIYDPIGQGERLQYVREDLSPRIGSGTREHLHAGNQQFLVGEFFGMWRAWDGIRALDYLLTRPEVDPDRIGVTGNSGGGTMTTWLCGVEDRWAMAAPSCFVTTFRRNLENELPQDTEQCPPRALALDLDHADFLAAMAPKPVIILAKERDYFDVRGSEETFARLKRLYRLLGAEDNIALFVGPSGHGYSQENREAMYSWFRRAARNSEAPNAEAASSAASDELELDFSQFEGVLRAAGAVEFTAEPEIKYEPDEVLWCTPNGQVAELPNTRTVFDFTREKAMRLKAARSTLRPAALRKAISEVLKLPALEPSPLDYRNWRYLGSRGYPSESGMAYTVDTEPGIHAIVYRLTDERWHSRPPASGPRAILYVSHLSSDEELRNEPLIGEVRQAEPAAAFFTCDVRGVGESMPGTSQPGSFHSQYGSDYFYAIHSLMLDRPYLGQKTWDVLRVLAWLDSVGHTDVHLIGRGWGALAATFAAVLSEQVRQITLKNALTSFGDIAENEQYTWPLSTLLPNVLAQFDLPDCYRELENKGLRQIDPWGPNEEQAGTG